MTEFNAREHFKATLMIFTAMLGGLFVFAMVALFVTYGKKEPQSDVEIFLTIAVFFGISALFIGPLIADKIIQRVLKGTFKEKMDGYRSAILIRLSFLEGATIFAIIGYLRTGNMFLMVVAAILVFMFRFNRPTPIRVAKQMQLKQEEARQLA